MLTPEYLQQVTEGAEDLASTLHAIIMNKIISRMIARLGRGEDYLLTATDKWQIQVLQEAGFLLEDIQQEITRTTKQQEEEIREAMEEAGVKSLDYDDKVYKSAGIEVTDPLQSPSIIRLLERDYKATSAEWRNFTRTTAQEAQKTFINAVDKAYRATMSGAISYSEAVKDAINEASREGLKVKYSSGRELTIESATAMIVRTGISQASAEIGVARMDEFDCDLVIVSSHLGARPSHQKWQGKIYSRSGKSKKYPDFVRSTGYGRVDGLCGANCRHNFSPYFEGISKNPFEKYNSKENKKAYEIQQKQRTIERRVRDTKRQVQNLQTAVDGCKDEQTKFKLQQELDRKSYLLKKQNEQYKQYCEDNDLKPYAERLRVAKFDRKQAMKAAGAAKRYENAKGK